MPLQSFQAVLNERVCAANLSQRNGVVREAKDDKFIDILKTSGLPVHRLQ